jgi:hypothetical protein
MAQAIRKGGDRVEIYGKEEEEQGEVPEKAKNFLP